MSMSISQQLPNGRALHIPLPEDRLAILQHPPGMSGNDVDFLIGYLGFMKAAITGGPIPKREDEYQK